MKRWLGALLLLAVGLPPILAVLLLPAYLYAMQEVIDWRRMRDPYEFLARWPSGYYELHAMTALDEAQRPHGFISRLTQSIYGAPYRRGSQTLQVAWNPDDTQVLTGSAAMALRWDVATGDIVAQHGARHRRDAPDSKKWGFGFNEVGWLREGAAAVAMTAGPFSLWFFGDNLPQPHLLDGQGYEKLRARGDRLALIKTFEQGQVLDIQTGQLTTLPHRDVSAIALLADGSVLTAARDQILWWRDGIARRTVPIHAPYNPLDITSDGRWVLVLTQQDVQLWSTDSGAKAELAHSQPASAVCGNGHFIATGTQDGHVHLYSAKDASPLRSFRASPNKIDALFCGTTRLATSSFDRTDIRLWDLAGNAHSKFRLSPAPPRLPWIAQLGADWNLPQRMPALTDWLRAAEHNNAQPWAVGALVLLLVLAYLLARSGRG